MPRPIKPAPRPVTITLKVEVEVDNVKEFLEEAEYRNYAFDSDDPIKERLTLAGEALLDDFTVAGANIRVTDVDVDLAECPTCNQAVL